MDCIGSWMFTFNEDDGRKMMNSAQNFSTLTKMALTILKNYQDEDKKTSVNRKRKKVDGVMSI